MGGTSWHSKSLASIYGELFTSDYGLTEAKAQERLSRFGKNEIVQPEKSPWFVMLLSQFYSLPVLLLLGAAAISLFLGLTVDKEKLIDAGAILAAVLLAATFGFWQEYKAESALSALKKMVVQHCLVVRGKRQFSVDAKNLIPGDIIILEEGSRVPADIRIVESVNLAVDQSTLTGESRPVEKEACTLGAKAVLSERRNMLFTGTTIVRGHAKGVVVETGMQTEFGKIVGYLSEEEEPETPLQKSLDNLARTLGYIGIAAAVIFFAFGLFRGETAVHMFVVAVTLAVAVIPEGLPTVLAITLAIGVQKMAKRNAIVRRMTAVETLGSATVICTDKTGTLTLNKMAVQELVFAEKSYSIGKGSLDSNAPRRDSVLSRALEIMALCNNAARADEEGVSTIKGDPTEAALLNAVISCGGNDYRIRSQHRSVGEVPFDSDRKMMSSIRLFANKRFALVKGAPEKVLPRCSSILLRKGESKLTQEEKHRMLTDSQSLGAQGMRVLAIAYRQVPKLAKYTSGNTERSLVFVGLVAMEDPPRPEVSEAIALCQSAGIRVVMITGDSLPTAQAIAARIGLLGGKHGLYSDAQHEPLSGSQDVLDGAELGEMDDTQLSYALKSTAVFARATPEQKYRIVTAFMKSGEVVAVTGDGVNDSPALKKADIGVAMGITGTDVSKEVSEIVLTDDNFASIVSAIKYGRTVFNNIKSFVRYQLSTNVAALCLMFSAPLLGMPLPLLPVQILWINIMIDGPPALALGAEPPSNEEMKKKPRNSKAPFISQNLALSIVSIGVVMAAIALAVFSSYLSFSQEKAFTAVFTMFVFLQLFNALNCRSAQQSILSRPLSNLYIYAAIGVSLLLHLLIIYLPALQEIFKTVPLEPFDLAVIAGSAFLIVILEEIKKKFFPLATAY